MPTEPNTVRKGILKVLDSMRDTEIDLVTFMEAIMTSNESRLRNVATGFLDRGGFQVVLKFMLKHLGFEGTKVKQSARCLTAVNTALGPEIWQVVGEILEQEISVYCRSPVAGHTSGTLTRESIVEFNLIEMRKQFDCHCPQLSRIMGLICSGNKGDSVDSVEDQGNIQEMGKEKEVVEEEEPEEVTPAPAQDADISTKRRLETKAVPARKKRRVRDKDLVGTVCLGILAFGHSRNANLLQMVMGYYMQGYNVAK